MNVLTYFVVKVEVAGKIVTRLNQSLSSPFSVGFQQKNAPHRLVVLFKP